MNIYHELAKSKGFHDEDEFNEKGEPTVKQMLVWSALIMSEYLEYLTSPECAGYQEDIHKPEGAMVELADIVIRCRDIEGIIGSVSAEGLSQFCETLPAALLELVESARAGSVMGFSFALGAVVRAVDGAVGPAGYELRQAIDRKHEYNKTRPHRHGKMA